MKSFALEIRSPEKALFMGRVAGLSVQAVDGSTGILADHAPLAAQLGAGKIVYRSEEGEVSERDCGGGFLIVKDNQVSVLLNS